jgi:hypothetical protein
VEGVEALLALICPGYQIEGESMVSLWGQVTAGQGRCLSSCQMKRICMWHGSEGWDPSKERKEESALVSGGCRV